MFEFPTFIIDKYRLFIPFVEMIDKPRYLYCNDEEVFCRSYAKGHDVIFSVCKVKKERLLKIIDFCSGSMRCRNPGLLQNLLGHNSSSLICLRAGEARQDSDFSNLGGVQVEEMSLLINRYL